MTYNQSIKVVRTQINNQSIRVFVKLPNNKMTVVKMRILINEFKVV